jgi:arylsulfatase A-like enzyme
MSAELPNIIYILGDDQRRDYLGCEGHPVLRTPNLDHLANSGIRFSQAFCTSPACTPSRTSHYTGQWERKHGINFNSRSSLSPTAWELSFPMLLKQAGYFLGWIGKNHVPAGGGSRGYDSGYFESVFDYWYGNHWHSGFYPKEFAEGGSIYRNAASDTQVEIFTEGVMDFLEPDRRFRSGMETVLPERPVDRPFCLCVTFNLPHDVGTDTMQLRPEDDGLYRNVYRDQQHLLQVPASYVPYETAFEYPRLPRSVYNGHYIPQYDYVKQPHTLRERQVRTCQTLTGIDRFVGRLRERLDIMGLADNTVIVFSTDHGLHHGEHGLGGKCFLYEEDIRIPLIIHDPRRSMAGKPKVRAELVVVPDLAPTIMDLCGLQKPDSMQGTSLVSLIDDCATTWRDEIFTEQLMDIQNYPRSESIRTATWKYIRYFARTEDPSQVNKPYRGTLDSYNDCLLSSLTSEQPVYEELFNLREDPGENLNLASDGQFRDTMETLRARLLQLGRQAKGDDAPPLTIPYGPGPVRQL